MESTTLTLWGLGVSITGFLFLAGWCWFLRGITSNNSKELEKRITFEWFENNFVKQCKDNHRDSDNNIKYYFDNITKEVTEIKDALKGTFDKKGLITKIHEHEDRLEKLEKR